MKKKIPRFKSDAAAERFVARADLTQYDLVLNSGRLGDGVAAELIAQAVRAKHLPEEGVDPFLGNGSADGSSEPV